MTQTYDPDLLEYHSPLLSTCPCGRHASPEEHRKAVRQPRRNRQPDHQAMVLSSGRNSLFRFARDLIPRFCWH